MYLVLIYSNERWELQQSDWGLCCCVFTWRLSSGALCVDWNALKRTKKMKQSRHSLFAALSRHNAHTVDGERLPAAPQHPQKGIGFVVTDRQSLDDSYFCGRHYYAAVWHARLQSLLFSEINKELNEWMKEWITEWMNESAKIKDSLQWTSTRQ